MAGHTDNSVFIDAPLDFVWERTNDVASWTELYSEYASAEVLQTNGNRIVFRLTLHPDENGVSWSWVSERILDEEARVTRSTRIETGPFKYMHLFWEYLAEDGGVRLRWVQDFEMKPQAPIDDEGMAARLNRNTATQMSLFKSRLEAAAALKSA
jgi:aromatase